MLYGGLWCLAGGLINVLTYQSSAATSETAGRYMIAWAAIAIGIVQFGRGILQALRR
jgi:hypothetical protein